MQVHVTLNFVAATLEQKETGTIHLNVFNPTQPKYHRCDMS